MTELDFLLAKVARQSFTAGFVSGCAFVGIAGGIGILIGYLV